MAVGLITSPSSWSLGTVLAPTWAQNVQDSINAWYGGSATVAGILIDGVGGNPNTLALRPKHIVVTSTGGYSSNFTAGTGAGTSPTLLASGSDAAFQVTLTTGSGPGTSSGIFSVLYTNAYHSAPVIVYSPANAAAAALSGTSAPSLSGSAGSGFTWQSGSAALAGATQYIWNFWIIDALNVNP